MDGEFAFEWDVEKAASNEAKHGISFETATRLLVDPNMIQRVDVRRECGERRVNAYGVVDGVALVVTYTHRGSRFRIISVRRASKGERRLYSEALEQSRRR